MDAFAEIARSPDSTSSATVSAVEGMPQSGSPDPARPDTRSRRIKMLLNRAEKNPSFVLRDRRCLKPRFIEELLELCDNVALTSPPEAPALAVTSSIPEL